MLDFYFDQQGGGRPKILRNLAKTFFFVNCNIVDAMLNFVLRYLVVSDMSIEVGVRLQLDTKLYKVMFYILCSISILINKQERIPNHSRI